MTSAQIRQAYLDFFRSKDHKIVPSAPIVNKDDPSLMFTNAGMNQFKDYFLGDKTPDRRRIADTQKCMRVSGKHNDLEDVGRDGTHHTMFEMLGNWSIGDYFKEEAIAWSWEFLTEAMGLDPECLYATVFEGAPDEGVPRDDEADKYWRKVLPADRILEGNKKDNFWEMGDTGPCGPCTEIHFDTRSREERAKVSGRDLVNVDDSGVVEIWNNVFIQFNRKADGSLENLPEKHVDTGMGFERLCMIMQGKEATYDTDVFTPLLREIERLTGKTYGGSYADDAKADMAMRVIVDHLRAVAFTIADGQLPGSGGAGYVVRRILRRAVRYAYSFLDQKAPFINKLMKTLVQEMGDAFPELKQQEQQITRIIESEEKSFLNTLENGLTRFANLDSKEGVIGGQDVFELYDTFGFPIDLTRLLASEQGLTIDEDGFNTALAEQKARSRKDAAKEVGDWTVLSDEDSQFIGFDYLSDAGAKITKFRTVKVRDKPQYHVVLDRTPFYGESGGQAGDTGSLNVGGETVFVTDTIKENDLTVHIVNKLPENPDADVFAQVKEAERQATSQNHTAAHLLHAALHEVLGKHAIQKGQDVRAKRVRFDFSHFDAVTAEELVKIENLVNEKVRQNIPLIERRDVPIAEARTSGAMMLFGEKYGDAVRIITFDPDFSSELCGGTHVKHTGELGLVKITGESSVAAGIRRIEAVTAEGAQAYVDERLGTLSEIRELLKGSSNPVKAVAALQDENRSLKKEIEKMQAAQAGDIKGDLQKAFEVVNGVNFLAAKVPLSDAAAIKTLAFQLTGEQENSFVLLGSENDGKALLTLALSKDLADKGELNAGTMIRSLAKHIKGGGGGQPFFATAGGKDPGGLEAALAAARVELVK
ncbi:alanine--tRNA ligase [Neolewinella persica]|uniref:alanine--tRNA ligase n=1 Tax=Neolewinella persica TaxID=70998 RepID=UPI00037DB84A|nr:alanine--tRNA ligase [Neolewinella persica]